MSRLSLARALVALSLLAGGGCRRISDVGLVDPARSDAGADVPVTGGAPRDGGTEAGEAPDLRPGAELGGADVGVAARPPVDSAPVDQCAAPVPCGACGGTVRCDGTCSKATPPDHGQACGKCGGTVDCAGQCSKATPPDHGQACGKCGGVIECNGRCSKPTPPNHAQPCGKCGGVVTCEGTCSVEDPPALGGSCGHAGTVQCNGGCLGPLFRLFHQATGDHFYTMSTRQRDDAVILYGYVAEKVACKIYEQVVPGTVPLYRLFNATVTDHFYTISAAERAQAMTGGYADEGVVGYVHATAAPGTVPLFRLFSPLVADHFYTVEPDEKERAIVQFGYVDEGITAHVLPP